MSILSRYVALAYLKMFSMCLGAFTAIYLVVDFMEKVARFTRADAQWQHILLFFVTKIPEMVIDAAPLAVLMATLLTLGALSMNSELTAMRSCGVSLARITWPILAIALLVSVGILAISELVRPASYAKRLYIQEVLIQKKSPSIYFRQQNIWHREEGTILRASLFDPKKRELKGITLWELAPGTGQPERRTDAVSGLLTDRGWVFRDVVTRYFREGEISATQKHGELMGNLKLKPDDLKVLGKYSDSMTLAELNRYCRKLREGGYDPTRYLTQFHSRISLPFGCAVMAFLGIPFALRGGRSSGIAFGQVGLLPPTAAAWAANFIFLTAGIWLSLTVDN